MTDKPRKKPGRKPIVIDNDKVEQLAAQGLGPSQIARALGISWDTYNKNKKRSSELSEAIKRGEARGLAKVSNSLFKSANEGNVTAQIFYLKNRAPTEWADRQEVNHNLDLKNVLTNARTRIIEHNPTAIAHARNDSDSVGEEENQG
tara:strand:+ start:384 stop:824 length:441 start_codon:yes stop_codon:yes gene_type:complete